MREGDRQEEVTDRLLDGEVTEVSVKTTGTMKGVFIEAGGLPAVYTADEARELAEEMEPGVEQGILDYEESFPDEIRRTSFLVDSVQHRRNRSKNDN